MKHKRLCIAGGGTGGHVMPALAMADAVRQRWPKVQVDFIGAQRGLEARLLPERGESVQLLPVHALQGQARWKQLQVLGWEVPAAVWRVLRSWRDQRPDVLVGVGGYASATGVLAALLAKVPIVLYEQNAMPGMVNRRLARWCDHVILGFAAAAEHLPAVPYTVTGNSVRQSILNIQREPHIPPRLLVMGGSQGARFLNDTIPELCAELSRQGCVFSVHHLCGKGHDVQALVARYADAGVDAVVDPFCEDMAAFYAAGDVLIARAGAMTVSEVLACSLPSVLIPLPSAADQHQHHNALQLAKEDGALLLDQHGFDVQAWTAQLQDLLFNPMQLMHMRQQLQNLRQDDVSLKQLAVLELWLGDQA